MLNLLALFNSKICFYLAVYYINDGFYKKGFLILLNKNVEKHTLYYNFICSLRLRYKTLSKLYFRKILEEEAGTIYFYLSVLFAYKERFICKDNIISIFNKYIDNDRIKSTIIKSIKNNNPKKVLKIIHYLNSKNHLYNILEVLILTIFDDFDKAVHFFYKKYSVLVQYEAYLILSELLIKHHCYNQASKLLSKIPEKNIYYYYLLKFKILYKKKKYLACLKTLNKLNKINFIPKNKLRFLFGTIYYKIGLVANARDYLSLIDSKSTFYSKAQKIIEMVNISIHDYDEVIKKTDLNNKNKINLLNKKKLGYKKMLTIIKLSFLIPVVITIISLVMFYYLQS